MFNCCIRPVEQKQEYSEIEIPMIDINSPQTPAIRWARMTEELTLSVSAKKEKIELVSKITAAAALVIFALGVILLGISIYTQHPVPSSLSALGLMGGCFAAACALGLRIEALDANKARISQAYLSMDGIDGLRGRLLEPKKLPIERSLDTLVPMGILSQEVYEKLMEINDESKARIKNDPKAKVDDLLAAWKELVPELEKDLPRRAE